MSAVLIEALDRRVLGGFVCADAITGGRVLTPLMVTAPQWTVRGNRSGIYVIFNGPGFAALTTQLIPDPTTWPPPISFEVTLLDPSRRYLSRRANVKAPQSVPIIPPSPGGVVPNPAVVAALADPTTVFDPQTVVLYPAPSAAVGANWSTIHASVSGSGARTGPLPWAVVQAVRQSDNSVLATGVSAPNGEALLAVVGLSPQVSTSGTGPVTTSTVAATVTAYFDPGTLTQPTGWISNPDDILGNRASATLRSASQTVQLGPGQETNLSFAIAL